MSVNLFKNGILTKIARGLNDATVTITNNLLATKSGTALDAVQGKVLDDKITEVNNSLMKHTLIWTNPNNSAFAAQTINIDVSPYDAIYIDFLPSTDDGSVQRAVPNQIIGKGGTVYISYSTTKSGGFPWVTTRSITVSDNSIVFSDCTQQQNNGSNYSTANYRIVPHKIYGIKF